MTPHEVAQAVVAVRCHFSDWQYDYNRYNGKIANPPALRDDSERPFFERIANHRDPLFFIVANLVENHRRWIGDIATDVRTYPARKGNVERLTYLVEQDLEKMAPRLEDNFEYTQGRHPRILRDYLADRITLETAATLVHLARVTPAWIDSLDVVGTATTIRLYKYAQFLPIDVAKIGKLLKSRYDRDVISPSQETTQWLHSQTLSAIPRQS